MCSQKYIYVKICYFDSKIHMLGELFSLIHAGACKSLRPQEERHLGILKSVGGPDRGKLIRQ